MRFRQIGLAGRVLMMILMASVAGAQVPLFETPVLGYARESAGGSIRPILGVPGAAALAAPLPLDKDQALLAVAPERDYALVTGPVGGSIVRWSRGQLTSTRFEGLGKGEGRIVFSPTSSSVALETAGRVAIWTGLPDAPVLARLLPQAAGADVLAVADDGQAVAWARGGEVYLCQAGETALVAQGGRISGLAFARGGAELAAADQALDQITVVRSDGSRAVLARGLQKPTHVAYSADGRKLAVASSATSSVALIDLATRDLTAASCECNVEALVPARGNAVFRLTDPAKGRTPLFDGDGAEPRIVFIASQEESK
jgi:hypothetical protein